MAKKRIQVNFRLDENLLAAIQSRCKSDKLSQSQFIIQALKIALEEEKFQSSQQGEAKPSVELRLNQLETSLAESRVREQLLSEKLAALEKQLREELVAVREELQSLGQQSPKQTPKLEIISDRVLGELRLGKQAPGYKVAKKALSLFIAELKTQAEIGEGMHKRSPE